MHAYYEILSMVSWHKDVGPIFFEENAHAEYYHSLLL